MDLTEPSSPTPLDDDDDDVLEASSALSDLTNMARARMVRQAKQDAPLPSAKPCGDDDDEAEPLPSVEYAQAKPSAEDVGAQEKELFQMQARARRRYKSLGKVSRPSFVHFSASAHNEETTLPPLP